MRMCVWTGPLAAAAASLTLTAGQALADPVIYYNTGNEFGWNEFNSGFEHWEGESYLDVTKSPSTQPTGPSTRTITRQHWPGFSSDDPGSHLVVGAAAVRFAVGDAVEFTHYYSDGAASSLQHYPAVRFSPGDTIGPSSALTHTGFTVEARIRNQDGSFTVHDLWGGGDGYIGLSFQMSGNTHYGWIHVSNKVGQAYAWAYESTPNTPITIPIPAAGTLPMVCVAGLAVMKRRRR
ncbi:MAG TPA: VPLPA-CTERM sorting domain-containing protein [Phycisphaerales bacterium]|nr:VPLPA-CTERM sorting domain-containing protein [Phycisphaerales bacterium]